VDRFPAGSRGLEPRSEEAGRDVAEGILCRLTALPGRFGGLDGVVTRPDRVWSAYPPAAASLTGDPEVDALLAPYVRPPPLGAA
jgi:hypothetical protein